MLEQTSPDLFLRCVSDLWWEAGGIGVLPSGEKPLRAPPLGLSAVNVLCRVPFGLLCGFTKYSVAGTAPGLTVTVGMLAADPGHSQAFLHQAASAEPLRQVPGLLRSRTWICYGSCGGSSDSTLPIPRVYVPTGPTAAGVRTFPAAGALIVLSAVSQAPNLGSLQRRCSSAVDTAVRRDFSSFTVTWPLRLSCGFSPAPQWGPSP